MLMPLMQALQIGMKFCGYRERSVKEVKDKLSKKDFDYNIIKATIKKLQDLGFLDNIRFSKSFSRGKNS